jgi:hypothetical protein
MATTDQELQQLNKTVSDAVNILKVWVGSSAQIKNLNEEQRKIIDKWFQVADEQEKTQKRQRAFTERARDAQGRFIARHQKSTNTFMNMAKSVGGMFSKMTKGITSSISSLAQGLMGNFSSFFQAVKTQFLGLFGEESEWFELLGSIKDSIVNVTGSIFNFIFRRTPAWAGKQIKILKDMYKLQVKQMKLDFMQAGATKKGKISWQGLLAAFLFTLGASIGAFLHRYFVAITKLPIFGKISKWFTKLDDIPFIGKLFKAVKFGFKWLGWPLTLILSVIDFIKAFKETEGSLFEKIKEGLWAALEGFIELPIRFLGWVVEKILGLFGVEVDGIGQKMLNIAKQGFMMIFDGWKMIFDLIKETFSIENLTKAWDFIKNIPSIIKTKVTESINNVIETMGDWSTKLMDAISPIINGVVSFFSNFWNTMVEWMASKIPSWLPGSDAIISGIESMKIATPAAGTSPATAAVETDKMKIANKAAQEKETSDKLKELNDTLRQGNENTKNALTSMTNVTAGGGQTTINEQEQIRDEIDNSLVALSVYGGA